MKLPMFKYISGLFILSMWASTVTFAQSAGVQPPVPPVPPLSPAAFADVPPPLPLLPPLPPVPPELPALPDLIDSADLEDLKTLALLSINPEVTASYNEEKRKVFNITYKVNSADMLNVENKFGKVHVNTWNRKEIQVKVDIVARAGTEQNAQRLLDGIKVMESREGKHIRLRTDIESMRVSGNANRSFEINYSIFMPEDNAVTVKNSFGDVYIADFKGKADLTVKYGSLKTNRLSNAANALKIAYGSGNCGFINQGTIDIAYSSLSVEGTNGLQGSSKFSDFKIGSLEKELALDVKYGSFKIENVSRNIQKINLESGFSPISLTFADNTAFNFDVNVQFADFKFDKSLVNLTSLEKEHTSAEYKGNFGGTAPRGSVSIISKYGDVKFIK